MEVNWIKEFAMKETELPGFWGQYMHGGCCSQQCCSHANSGDIAARRPWKDGSSLVLKSTYSCGHQYPSTQQLLLYTADWAAQSGNNRVQDRRSTRGMGRYHSTTLMWMSRLTVDCFSYYARYLHVPCSHDMAIKSLISRGDRLKNVWLNWSRCTVKQVNSY